VVLFLEAEPLETTPLLFHDLESQLLAHPSVFFLIARSPARLLGGSFGGLLVRRTARSYVRSP